MQASAALEDCVTNSMLQAINSSAPTAEQEVSSVEDATRLAVPVSTEASAHRTSKVSDRGGIPSALSQTSDTAAIQQRAKPEDPVPMVHHESIPEILPSRSSNKSRKVSKSTTFSLLDKLCSYQWIYNDDTQPLLFLQVSVTSSIAVDRQHSNLPSSNANHASPGATTLPPHHARATRMLPRQPDADVEMQAPSRVDGSNDGIGYIESAVPSSPAPSVDRLSACSSSGRGQRKVMALHTSHAGMREGVGQHGSYAQPAYLGPAAHRMASPAAREHLVSSFWMVVAESCRFRAIACGIIIILGL